VQNTFAVMMSKLGSQSLQSPKILGSLKFAEPQKMPRGEVERNFRSI